ncbi:hypothetical protein Ssi02_22330 [Sinosporangium siamense]|uniref:Uncharacterized protein n=1 Tax=Sinosporangium siamense TaxID=1367973 RepID=A0A919RE29_9ACTN|nr:hypothetical protein Ssi02_22330 [Sinosporangium siamense]
MVHSWQGAQCHEIYLLNKPRNQQPCRQKQDTGGEGQRPIPSPARRVGNAIPRLAG